MPKQTKSTISTKKSRKFANDIKINIFTDDVPIFEHSDDRKKCTRKNPGTFVAKVATLGDINDVAETPKKKRVRNALMIKIKEENKINETPIVVDQPKQIYTEPPPTIMIKMKTGIQFKSESELDDLYLDVGMYKHELLIVSRRYDPWGVGRFDPIYQQK